MPDGSHFCNLHPGITNHHRFNVRQTSPNTHHRTATLSRVSHYDAKRSFNRRVGLHTNPVWVFFCILVLLVFEGAECERKN